MYLSQQKSTNNYSRSRWPTRVIKFGGSLLEDPESCERFNIWHRQQPQALNLMIVGGGVAVDQLRLWDSRFSLPPVWVHFQALACMTANTQLLAQALPEWTLTRLPAERILSCHPRGLMTFVDDCLTIHRYLVLVDLTDWLAEQPGLPQDWTVTSDSIAAHLACKLGAAELVLLKSSLPPVQSCGETPSRQELVHSPWVDRAFARFSTAIETLRLVNLSDPACPEICCGPVTPEEIRR